MIQGGEQIFRTLFKQRMMLWINGSKTGPIPDTEHRRMDQEKTWPGELLTQLLTGHGCYRAYLYKYGHDVAEACPECRNERETAEHEIVWRGRWVSR